MAKNEWIGIEQNSSPELIREYFESLTSPFTAAYNDSGREWGYIFFKRKDGRYGSILRVSSMDGTMQLMYKYNNIWSEWIAK